jgi:hypothetical protein
LQNVKKRILFVLCCLPASIRKTTLSHIKTNMTQGKSKFCEFVARKDSCCPDEIIVNGSNAPKSSLVRSSPEGKHLPNGAKGTLVEALFDASRHPTHMQ